MKLGELKSALRKLPPDMDDMEVCVVTGKDGKKKYELLCFTGYLPAPGNEAIALGGLSAVQVMVESGEIPKPAGYDNLVDGLED